RGADGTMDWLRSRAYLAFINGCSLDDLLAGLLASDQHDDGAGGPAADTTDIPADLANPAVPPGLAALTGAVNLTMPASAWLGLSETPGEAGGIGALDAGTCRDLTAALAANPATRWCVTLVSPDGRPVAHGCARAGPGPPGTDRRSWLATIKITP